MAKQKEDDRRVRSTQRFGNGLRSSCNFSSVRRFCPTSHFRRYSCPSVIVGTTTVLSMKKTDVNVDPAVLRNLVNAARSIYDRYSDTSSKHQVNLGETTRMEILSKLENLHPTMSWKYYIQDLNLDSVSPQFITGSLDGMKLPQLRELLELGDDPSVNAHWNHQGVLKLFQSIVFLTNLSAIFDGALHEAVDLIEQNVIHEFYKTKSAKLLMVFDFLEIKLIERTNQLGSLPRYSN